MEFAIITVSVEQQKGEEEKGEKGLRGAGEYVSV